MPRSSRSKPGYDFDDSDSSVDLSGWTNSQDSESHQKRSDIFHEIIKKQCLDQLRTIVESGWDVNEELDGNESHVPLLYTINQGQQNGQKASQMVHLLLEHGANPNVTYREDIGGQDVQWVHKTALHKAVRLNLTEVVKMLLNAGAKCTTSDGLQNPLVLALQNEDCPTDLIKLLLKHGADPNDHDDQLENNPLFTAIRMYDCAYGKDSDDNKDTNTRVKLLLQHGANPNVTHSVNIVRHGEAKWVQRTALHAAAAQGWTQGVKMLLDAGANYVTSDVLENPLALALQNYYCPVDLIKLLLKLNADPNDHDGQPGNIPLLNAIENGGDGRKDTTIVKLLLKHGANPNVAHSVNIAVDGEAKWVQRAALHQAVTLGKTDVVSMLLDAGVNCTTSDGLQKPLALALHNNYCPKDLIELLLKHGADPNDHDDQRENIPLSVAISNCWYDHDYYEELITIIKLLLEHGANPNVTYRANDGTNTSDVLESPLALALDNYSPPDLINLLLKHGRDVDYVDIVDGKHVHSPLLQRLARYYFRGHTTFLPQQLDLVFLHGGNISHLLMENGEHRTALECAVRGDVHCDSIRWLIRHGADTALKFTLLKEQFMPKEQTHFNDPPEKWILFPETPIILLQAGMRVSHGVQTQLNNMELALSTWRQDNPVDESDSDGTVDDSDSDDTVDGSDHDRNVDGRNMRRTMHTMWDQLRKAEEEELQRVQCNPKKSCFPEYWTSQMVDLQEFSDESLQVYPEYCDESLIKNKSKYQHMLDQIHRVQEFLSQPQSLQWYCRRRVRENLVSLQPSVVKKLSVPAILKRYILCHEI